MRYAQLNAENVCIAVSNLAAKVNLPHMVELQENEAPIGKKWVDGAWKDTPPYVPTEAELAALELQAIDAATGMSRTMREAFIALGAKVGADVTYLQQQETKAAAARLKLK